MPDQERRQNEDSDRTVYANGPKGSQSQKRRWEVGERDGWICHICGEKIDPESRDRYERATLDHVIPRSHGGRYWASNMRIAHQRCNSDRGAEEIT